MLLGGVLLGGDHCSVFLCFSTSSTGHLLQQRSLQTMGSVSLCGLSCLQGYCQSRCFHLFVNQFNRSFPKAKVISENRVRESLVKIDLTCLINYQVHYNISLALSSNVCINKKHCFLSFLSELCNKRAQKPSAFSL